MKYAMHFIGILFKQSLIVGTCTCTHAHMHALHLPNDNTTRLESTDPMELNTFTKNTPKKVRPTTDTIKVGVLTPKIHLNLRGVQ